MSVALDDFVYDPFAPEVMSNPLPFYEVLRDRFPVYYAEKYDTFFLSRFQDAWDFLSLADNMFVTNEGSVFTQAAVLRHNTEAPQDKPTTPFGSHLNYGSPVYELVRQAHGRQLRPGNVRKLEPFIRSLVRRRLDQLIPAGRFDLVHEFAGIISASTICHLFHIPVEDAGEVLDTINVLTRTDNDEPGFKDVQEHQVKLIEFIRPRVATRRADGPDGSWPLVDGMLEFRLDGRELTDVEIAANLTCVLVGGTETLPKVVGHGLWELNRRPDQLAEVRSDLAANSAAAAEEMNRFCGPAQWFGRTAREPVTIAGQSVRPGQRVAYLTQSANRDPREFENPNRFQWNRSIPRTLAFGRGQHFCVGIHLARLEERIILEEFLGRVTGYEIDEDAAVRHPSSFQWGYSHLPVTITSTALPGD
ncbi:cytochrome P450 [Actinoplanes lutulentus]|uniref:Cytochrome P450 n=1 Tax=Actinoplanes lutulentus TaxID=1287878 RepID=A0A327Z1W8_9ACTN|nr:cytochrome P450 [Actinoplanes lutulentus]MBB2943325.1 cytochrome P450 [Actinoplanes lutulentus]RAK28384.1 cytochrome P450 [Actinoplanes lutulentus]